MTYAYNTINHPGIILFSWIAVYISCVNKLICEFHSNVTKLITQLKTYGYNALFSAQSLEYSHALRIYNYNCNHKSSSEVQLHLPFNIATFTYQYPEKKSNYKNPGQVYYNYRYYSPELGRWLSRDPIGEVGGLNLYIHTSNNPINFSDVLGFYEESQTRVYMTERPQLGEGWKTKSVTITAKNNLPKCESKTDCWEKEGTVTLTISQWKVGTIRDTNLEENYQRFMKELKDSIGENAATESIEKIKQRAQGTADRIIALCSLNYALYLRYREIVYTQKIIFTCNCGEITSKLGKFSSETSETTDNATIICSGQDLDKFVFNELLGNFQDAIGGVGDKIKAGYTPKTEPDNYDILGHENAAEALRGQRDFKNDRKNKHEVLPYM